MTMPSTTVARLVLLVSLALAASGCEAIGTIFKAGMVTGVVAVVLIVAVIGFAWVKLRR